MDAPRGQRDGLEHEGASVGAVTDRETFLVVGVERCPYCDYELAGLRARRCPECGAEITAEDIRLDARRRVFLELTTWQVVWGHLLLLGLCMVTTSGLAVLPYALGLLAVYLVPDSSGSAVVRRVRRRVWLVAMGRLYSPWVVLIVGIGFLSMFFYFGSVFAGSVMGRGEELLGPEAMLVLLLVLYLGGAQLWRRRLRKVGRLAGLSEAQVAEAYPRRGAATRLAVGPVLVVVVALLVGIPLSRLIGRIWPDWGLGF